MHLIPGFALFVLGFAMLTGGIGLLVAGDITFKSGKRIPQRLARKVGGALIAFFPLVLAGNFVLRLLDPDGFVPGAVVNLPLALLCLGVGLAWLLRGMEGGKPLAQRTATQAGVAFDDAPAGDEPGTAILDFDGPAAAPAPPARRKRRQNPFDFT